MGQGLMVSDPVCRAVLITGALNVMEPCHHNRLCKSRLFCGLELSPEGSPLPGYAARIFTTVRAKIEIQLL
jgi:hypothetical protein